MNTDNQIPQNNHQSQVGQQAMSQSSGQNVSAGQQNVYQSNAQSVSGAQQSATQSQSNAQDLGIPSVAGKRKRKNSKGAAMFLFAVLLVGLLALLLVTLQNQDFSGSRSFSTQDDEQKDNLTSKRELTLPPMPEPDVVHEPETVKVEAPETLEPPPLPPVLVADNGMPLIQSNVQQYDNNGEVLPTLEELKFAAPMMGQIANSTTTAQRSNEEAVGARYLDELQGNQGSFSLSSDSTAPENQRNLEPKLTSMTTSLSAASIMRNTHFTLSKGTVIECILESRVDTSVPGLTSCVIPRDIYSMDGRVLLVEKGTKAVGEYQGAVQNGLERIFMLWTELRTPNGILISLNSPAADALGAAGMGGYVDHHWFKRFGNALLFSMVADGFQYLINTANEHNNNGDVTYENTDDGIDEIIEAAMQQSGNIPPTLIKNQGEKVAIFVARDLSFESVYKVRKTHAASYQ